MRTAIFLVAILVVVSFVTYYLYFGPRAAGADFISGLESGNGDAIRQAMCEDTDQQELFDGSAAVLEVLSRAGIRANGEAEQRTFTPFENRYAFEYAVGGDPVEISVTIELEIEATSLLDFCVSRVEFPE